jgi:putative hydrolase of HD superfamily
VHDAEAITARQVAGLVPDDAAKLIAGLVAEYEANETTEAQLAHDADKLELILQADEYADQGYDTSPWREAALPSLRTGAARQLAEAISATPPASWYLGHRAAYERRWLRRPGNDAYLSERRDGDGTDSGESQP